MLFLEYSCVEPKPIKMKRILLFSFFFALIFSAFAQNESPYIKGELIVQLAPGVRTDNLEKDLYRLQGKVSGLKLKKVLSDNQNIVLLDYNAREYPPNYVLDKVRGHEDVLLVQFNHIVQERLTPNDPSLGTQWHHVDASDNDIDSDLAWDITTGGLTQNGDEIVVCVIEGGGSNYNHTDLIANHWVNTGEIPGNGIDDDGNGYVDDYNGWNPVTLNDNVGAGGHGTAVSGMIGAKGNNSNGGVGVNWDVKIMQVGLGSLTEASVISSYEYAFDMRNLYNTTNGAEGAFVVATNASWGIDNANPSSYPVWCAYYDALGAVGILNCGATANNNVNVDSVGDMPTGCSSDYMVAVTATNSSDVRTFSGYGINSIDLGAPGESVFLPSGSSGYSSTSGTSFASPCVAGAIALMYSAPCSDIANLALSNPQAAADLIRTYLFQGVDPVANLATEVATGGRLNVNNSINLLLGNCGPLPPCEPNAIALTPMCYFNELNSTVESGINLQIELTENYCDVEQVCYRQVGAGSYTCIDLQLQGVILDNSLNSFTIQNLNSNTNYEVYYTTADGTSAVATTSTLDCVNEIPGCTDNSALNYNANATFDDGSCTYPCVGVDLSILTDCWGEETSWTITDANGSVVASVAPNSYGDQITYNWNQCLEAGCYTFTISDSFGDGLNGALYASCGVNGNYTITDVYGNTLVQMATPNFGAQSVHEFCVTYVDLNGCMDPSACNYEPGATTDDGSCEFSSCVGCTNPLASNYDPSASIDDGSCFITCSEYTITLLTDCYAAETSWSLEADGAGVIQSAAAGTLTNSTTYSYSFCLEPGCYNFIINDTFGDGLNGSTDGCLADGEYSISDGLGTIVVVMPNVNFGFGTTHQFCNEELVPCIGDFNGDNERNIADLLFMLSEYGCSGAQCITDLNDDNLVNTGDLSLFLAVFGTPCN